MNSIKQSYIKKMDTIFMNYIYETVTDNLPVRIYVNKIENVITFKFKLGYYLELLTPQLVNLFGSDRNKMTKNKNQENVSNFEITEAVLVHCNTVNNDYGHDSSLFQSFIIYFTSKFNIFKNF